MNELLTLTAAELGARIASRQISSEEVTQAHLERINEVDGDVHAFLLVDHDGAVEAARRIDSRIASGEKLGPLAGVPLAVKDLFCTKGLATTASSRMLEGWVPPYNSTIVSRCKDAGMVILGKTNLDEFAMGSSTETSAFGPTHNPWDLDRIPGGSGGGSSASLASFESPLALGTDTGGSIRQPGAVTGTVGIKPTYGSTSRYGVIAMASSLDTPGPCARTVLDAALLHQVMAGHDPMDQTTIDQPTPAIVEAANQPDVAGMKIGVVTEFAGEGYDPQVEARFNEAVEMLTAAGAQIVEVSCPHFDLALPAYYLIQPAELSSNLARYDAMRYGLRVDDDGEHSAEQVMRATRGAGFGAEAKRRIILGTYALSAGYYDAYYGSAQKVRTLIQRDFEKAWQSCDVLVSPATPTTAFRLGERTADPMAMYRCDLCTIPANMAGSPAGSFPIGLSETDGMPVGMQVMAPIMADDRVYRVGAALERLLNEKWGGPLLAQAPELRGHDD
ncbi:Asp-tRNA(Asn)/Glu-tRNA(Gln) amidotransferase subunit GatA [Cutibacterium equinum]|uniref:Glutamyl-tRNA(Gln) amidotransferase subunit A n=1 Tax=Cutibacterium equinum TaxID=3016342 RepID=A0ABY7R0L4_9ACTN|nr:Asp-tRNA(Asn)/Glu-tRNA(Gln) amidotransferase subunit GatA [Cutibacterium equinum]WCC80833.1 Asp-tRNA(Asn)/Glu-tRNA(Gln) amidotransferase subunit GatA [Cutibacterium equinum]